MKISVICKICETNMKNPVMLQCKHIYDKECIELYSEYSTRCPECNEDFRLDDTMHHFKLCITSSEHDQLIEQVEKLEINQTEPTHFQYEDQIRELNAENVMLNDSLKKANKEKDEVDRQLNLMHVLFNCVQEERVELSEKYHALYSENKNLVRKLDAVQSEASDNSSDVVALDLDKVCTQHLSWVLEEIRVARINYNTAVKVYDQSTLGSMGNNALDQSYKEVTEYYEKQKTKLYALRSLRQRGKKKVIKFNELIDEVTDTCTVKIKKKKKRSRGKRR
ncbi:MAG: hypothetical protein EXX96DRAFT_541851 [Benjaminiella poitrasii]|nr:MAG: hypothetical protein EXX96DRAFT_541851 [Benjaminiella poitrasii]